MTRTTLRALTGVAAVAMLAPATAASADNGYDIRPEVAAVGDPEPDVRFEGAGWGHGVGMSQYGAYARARDGHSAHDILTSYFPDTTLPDRDTSGAIRVGLRQGVSCVDIQATGGTVEWQATEGDSSQTLTQPGGETWYVHALASGDRARIQDAPCGESDYETIETFGDDVVLDVQHDGTRIDTSDAGEQFHHGTHRIRRVSNGMTTVQHLGSVETYLRGVAEVPDSWGDHDGVAALRAQAIAARGFALRRLADPRGGDCHCDLLNTVSDQVYRGVDHGPNWVEAVRGTAEQVLVDGDGAVAQTFYSSSNGGRSENNEDVWGGSAIGYLRSIDDPYSLDAVNPYRSWTATVDNETVAEALSSDLASVEAVSIQGHTDGGTPQAIAFRGRDGDGEQVNGTLANDNGVGAGVTIRGRLSSGVDVVRDDGSAGVDALPSSQISDIHLGYFSDDAGDHQLATLWAHEAGVAAGYEDGTFRPGSSVTRGQMASFIHRTFGIPDSSGDHFTDVDPDGPHGARINALAEAGIAEGFEDGTFRSGTSMSRAQMASFLVRAIGLDEVAPDGRFSDVTDGPHAGAIHAIAEAGITVGCRDDAYCPNETVRRGQMASFLHRTVEGG